jgi:hypothetical protein
MSANPFSLAAGFGPSFDPFADSETDAAAFSGLAQTSGIATAKVPYIQTESENLGLPTISNPRSSSTDWVSLAKEALSAGVGIWKNNQQVGLLQAQINKGQTPSIVAGPNGTPSAPYSITTSKNGTSAVFGSTVGGSLGTISPTIIVFVVLALLAVLFLKR